MVQFIIREHQPGSLAVAFDLPGETFRDEMVADYKAGRAEAPKDLPPQFEMIREVMHALAIPVVEAPGFEADDVLATLATEARDRGCDVVVVTGDRDSFQLIEDPHVRVLYNRRGVSDYSLYDEAGIVERCGVPPSKYVMLAALRGDPSDNLPGIPGVGEKTAAKLLNAYGDLDGIFAHLDEQTPKLRENLTNNEELARSNATVIPLVRDVPLTVHVDQLQLGGWDLKTAEAAFAKYELKTHWQRVEELLAAGALGEAAEGSAAPSGSGTVLTKDAKASLATLRSGTGGAGGQARRGPRARGRGRRSAGRAGRLRRGARPDAGRGGDRGSGGLGRRDPQPGRPLGRRRRPQPAEGPGAGGHRGRRRGRRGDAAGRPALVEGRGRDAHRGDGRIHGGPPGQRSDAVAAPARDRLHRVDHGHRRGRLPARRLDRGVRALRSARRRRPAAVEHGRSRSRAAR